MTTPSMAALIQEAKAHGLTVAHTGWRNLVVIGSGRTQVRLQAGDLAHEPPRNDS